VAFLKIMPSALRERHVIAFSGLSPGFIANKRSNTKKTRMLTPTIPSHTQTHTRRSLTVTVSRLIAYLLINRAKEFLLSRSAKARNRPV
jgi:hypothetical protein